MVKLPIFTSGMAALAAAAVLVACGCGPTKTDSSGNATTTTTTNTTAANNGGATLVGRDMPTAAGNKIEGDTIKVGLIASLNGEQQPWGQDSKDGTQLAIDEINGNGGINGKKLQLVVGDTGIFFFNDTATTEIYTGEDKVVCVLGEVASGITIPAAQVCQDAGVPIIAIGATRVDVTQQGGATFRVCYTDNFQGAAMAKYAYEDLKLRNVAIMTDRKLPYSTGLSDVFRAAFTKEGGNIVTEEKYESGNLDFKAQLTNIKAKNPDGMFCSGYFTEVGPIARQRMDVGLGDIKMLGGDGWDSKDLFKSGGDGIVGGYFSNHYSDLETRPEVQDFVKKFHAKFNRDAGTAMAALSYDAAMVMAQALKDGNPSDSLGLIKAIGNVKDYKGVTGTITIGPDGNAQKPTLVLQVQKDGQFKPVKQIPFFVFNG